MGTMTKKYRLFWITETKEMINNYEDDYTGSITMYPDDGTNSYFESDVYQDILDKIETENLIKMVMVDPNSIVPPIPS